SSGWTLATTIRYDRSRPVVVLDPIVELGPDSGTTTLEYTVADPRDPMRILGQFTRGRFVVRMLGRRTERAREFPAPPPAAVLDDSVFALYLPVAWLGRTRAAQVTAVFPRAGRRELLAGQDLAIEPTTPNRDRSKDRHEAFVVLRRARRLPGRRGVSAPRPRDPVPRRRHHPGPRPQPDLPAGDQRPCSRRLGRAERVVEHAAAGGERVGRDRVRRPGPADLSHVELLAERLHVVLQLQPRPGLDLERTDAHPAGASQGAALGGGRRRRGRGDEPRHDRHPAVPNGSAGAGQRRSRASTIAARRGVPEARPGALRRGARVL